MLLIPGPFELLPVLLLVAVVLGGGLFLFLRRPRLSQRTIEPKPRVMAPGAVGFCVLYRWRLVPGREDEFRVAWERLTKSIREERGGLGSRLHRGHDGVWWAYAQWPSEAMWRAAMSAPSVDDEAASQMGETILERLVPIPLTLLSDLCVTSDAAAAASA